MKPQDVERYIEDLKREADVQSTIKSTMQFPSRDLAQLFEKFSEPVELKQDETLTREVNTANFDNNSYLTVATQLSIRKDFQQFKKQFLVVEKLTQEEIAKLSENEKRDYYDKMKAIIWVDSIVETIGSDAMIVSAASKGRGGWLGELIISSKRIGEVFTVGMKDKVKGGLFGR